jgi:hypothetical protein
MKKRTSKIVLLTLGVIFFLAGDRMLEAAPLLTCDCTPAVDKVLSFQLQFGAAAWIDTPAVLTCGTEATAVNCTGDSRTLCYDLVVLPLGAFTVKGRAKNIWETSLDSLPLSDSKQRPGTLPSMRIIP